MRLTFRNLFLASILLAAALQSRAVEKVYDSSRDPVADLKAAQTQAAAEHKLILMDVGGNWCPWCLVLDSAFNYNQKIKEILADDYVIIHVNMSTGNPNKEFLSHYPKISGYPCLFILTAEGTVLNQQDTNSFGPDSKVKGAYDESTILKFLKTWAKHK